MSFYKLFDCIAVGPRSDALKPLVKLIPDLLAASRAPSTAKGYHSQFLKWKAWAASFPEVTFFPASALHFSVYLISLVQSGYSFSTINSAFYSVNVSIIGHFRVAFGLFLGASLGAHLLHMKMRFHSHVN